MPFPIHPVLVITDAILDDVLMRMWRGESRTAIATSYHVKERRLFDELKCRDPGKYEEVKQARQRRGATRAMARQQEAEQMAKDASRVGTPPNPVKHGKGIYLPGSGRPYSVPEERRDPPRWPVREMAAFSAEELAALARRAVEVLTTGLGSAGVGVMRRKWEE